ncbi:MAG TPA: NfeD family protein [Methylophilaceae bacterium]|nr:NfeD family protein [Methylophilaceae bacterium]HQR60041.1 NfeD family protein [Methylophilaceae bacterium]
MLQPLWAWAILGLVLLGAEMLSGTFYLLWFGIAALCVALLLALWPDAPFSLQLLAFSVLALTSLTVWKLKYHGKVADLRIGQSHGDAIGQAGRISATVAPEQLGRITFTMPVMGSREWTAVSDERIEAGETAVVSGIEGNYLRVNRAN